MFRRQRTNGRQPLADRLGNLARVPAGPDAGAVDAASAAVDEDALDHQVEVVLPAIDLIVAEQNLREARAVRLHTRIAAVAIDRGCAAEDEAAGAGVEHGRADVARRPDRWRSRRRGMPASKNAAAMRYGVHGSCGPGFSTRPHLHRDDRQPQRVHARRVRRQDQTEHRALHLVTDRNAALLTVPGREHVEREPARQRLEDVAHLAQHERVLLHVRAAHALGESRARRLRVDELVGGLRAIAHGERGVHVQLAGPADARDQIVDRDLAQRVARALGLARVALDQSAVGAADSGNRLPGREVHDLVHFHAGVGFAPT